MSIEQDYFIQLLGLGAWVYLVFCFLNYLIKNYDGDEE